MSSGSKTKTVKKEEKGPWKPAVPYLTDIMGQAKTVYNQGQGDTFAPFSTVVPFSNQSEDALGMFEDRARNGSPLLDAANTQVLNMMAGNYGTSPYSNYLTGTAQGNDLNGNPWLDSMFDQAADKITNRINGTAGLRGRAGSGAHQQMLQSKIGDLANSVYAQNYQQERERQSDAISKLQSAWENDYVRRLSAIGAVKPLADAPYGDAQVLRDVGSHRETMAKMQLADLQGRHDFGQTNPWNQLNNYNGIIGPMGAQGYTVDGTTTHTEKTSMGPLGVFDSLVGTLATAKFPFKSIWGK